MIVGARVVAAAETAARGRPGNRYSSCDLCCGGRRDRHLDPSRSKLRRHRKRRRVPRLQPGAARYSPRPTIPALRNVRTFRRLRLINAYCGIRRSRGQRVERPQHERRRALVPHVVNLRRRLHEPGADGVFRRGAPRHSRGRAFPARATATKVGPGCECQPVNPPGGIVSC